MKANKWKNKYGLWISMLVAASMTFIWTSCGTNQEKLEKEMEFVKLRVQVVDGSEKDGFFLTAINSTKGRAKCSSTTEAHTSPPVNSDAWAGVTYTTPDETETTTDFDVHLPVTMYCRYELQELTLNSIIFEHIPGGTSTSIHAKNGVDIHMTQQAGQAGNKKDIIVNVASANMEAIIVQATEPSITLTTRILQYSDISSGTGQTEDMSEVFTVNYDDTELMTFQGGLGDITLAFVKNEFPGPSGTVLSTFTPTFTCTASAGFLPETPAVGTSSCKGAANEGAEDVPLDEVQWKYYQAIAQDEVLTATWSISYIETVVTVGGFTTLTDTNIAADNIVLTDAVTNTFAQADVHAGTPKFGYILFKRTGEGGVGASTAYSVYEFAMTGDDDLAAADE